MFERFTKAARAAVIRAQEVARDAPADAVRPEHLLHALLDAEDPLVDAVLDELGVDRAAVRDDLAEVERGPRPPLDAEALSTLGIDLDAVRRQVEDAFGPGALDRARAGGRPRGHLPFDRSSKKVLELTLREALHLHHRSLGPEHILLGLLHRETGAAHDVLTRHGGDLHDAREAVARLAPLADAG
ncbi:MAG TPA: Clp protease N-terminal domain-containing protein [Acidimicrobiales bacterium]